MTNIQPGGTAKINSTGDLMMDRDLGAHIGEVVEVVRVQKSGLIEVKTSAGLKAYPKRNLTPLKISSFSGIPPSRGKVVESVTVYPSNWGETSYAQALREFREHKSTPDDPLSS